MGSPFTDLPDDADVDESRSRCSAIGPYVFRSVAVAVRFRAAVRPAILSAVRFRFVILTLLATGLAAQTVVLETTVVTASRTPQPPEHVPFSLKVLDAEAIRSNPAATV